MTGTLANLMLQQYYLGIYFSTQVGINSYFLHSFVFSPPYKTETKGPYILVYDREYRRNTYMRVLKKIITVQFYFHADHMEPRFIYICKLSVSVYHPPITRYGGTYIIRCALFLYADLIANGLLHSISFFF